MSTPTLRRAGRALLCGAALTALAVSAQAETLRYAIGWPPNTTATDAVQTFADTAEDASGGDLSVKVYPLSLLNFLEASSGVRDGIADIVTILVPYFLAEFPVTNFASELSGLADLEDGIGDRASLVFAGALSEYVLLDCEDCWTEFAAQNQAFIAAASSPPYVLQCVKPIVSATDLEGARLRAGGAFWARWAEKMGATTVSMSINETFEGLNQGVLDCTMSSGAELSQFGFIDVVDNITTDVPGAVYSSATASINLETWRSLSDADRTALMKAGAALSAHMTWNYWTEANANFDAAREKGIAFNAPDETLLSQSHDYIVSDADALVADYTERFGMTDGAAKLAKMRELIAKWVPLVQDIETVDALEALYWDEVMSKVDVSTYAQ